MLKESTVEDLERNRLFSLLNKNYREFWAKELFAKKFPDMTHEAWKVPGYTKPWFFHASQDALFRAEIEFHVSNSVQIVIATLNEISDGKNSRNNTKQSSDKALSRGTYRASSSYEKLPGTKQDNSEGS